jgi:hypothetical protein
MMEDMPMTQTTNGKQKKTGAPKPQATRTGKRGNSRIAKPQTLPMCMGLSPPPAPTKSTTKTQICIGLLKRRKGASIQELQEVTGWQAHSVRGFLSGTVRTKLGLDVTSRQVGDRGRVYQVSQGQ